MNFNDVKNLCETHTRLLKKTNIIQRSKKENIWLKVINANGKEFYLEDDEVEMLEKFIEEKGFKIEETIGEFLSK